VLVRRQSGQTVTAIDKFFDGQQQATILTTGETKDTGRYI
jgi:hypothetical protein